MELWKSKQIRKISLALTTDVEKCLVYCTQFGCVDAAVIV